MDVLPVSVPLRRRFVISAGDLSVEGALGRVIVRLRSDDGVEGYGEAVALPTVMGFTVHGLSAAIAHYLAPAVVGHDLSDVAGLHRLMDRALVGNQPAKAAVDIAVHDALGRTLGVSIATLLGGTARAEIPLSKSVGTDIPARLRDEVAEVVGEGYPVVKLKLACSSADADRVAAAADSLGETALLRLDANAGYANSAEAINHLRRLVCQGLYLVEQPLGPRDLTGMRQVRDILDVPILADESMGDRADAVAILRSAAADVLNIKVQAAGGLRPAMQIAALAEAHGVPILIGSRMETGIGAAAGLQLMAALPESGHACDLKGPDTYVGDLLETSLVIRHGHAVVPTGAGLGVHVDAEQITLHSVDSP